MGKHAECRAILCGFLNEWTILMADLAALAQKTN